MRVFVLKSLLRAQNILRKSYTVNKEALTYSQLKQSRFFSNNLDRICNNENDVRENDDEHNLTPAVNVKYKVFHDETADIILDVSEEQEKIDLELLNKQKETYDPYSDINLKRGITGVFDIEDLVTLLKKDKAQQIFVASVPKEYAYVDYIVIVTGKSAKHMSALANFVRKVYKLKKKQTDLIPKIEGVKSNNWIALDLGNIALHIFSSSSRSNYDLETLWSVGTQYDDKSNVSEETDIMDQYNTFLADLAPADNK